MPPAVKRRLVNLAATASLAGGVIVALAAMADSPITMRWLSVRNDERAVNLISSSGYLVLQCATMRSDRQLGPHAVGFRTDWGSTGAGNCDLRPVPDSLFGRSGIITTMAWMPWDRMNVQSEPFAMVLAPVRSVFVPYWLILVSLTSVGFLSWRKRAVRMRAEHRRSHGLCEGCGYDVRASPDRCPECGAVPAAPPAR
jgi:hypothetical protein